MTGYLPRFKDTTACKWSNSSFETRHSLQLQSLCKSNHQAEPCQCSFIKKHGKNNPLEKSKSHSWRGKKNRDKRIFLLLLFFMTGRENLITDRSAHIQYSLTSTHKECLCDGEEKHGEEYVTNCLITIWIIVIHVMNLHISTDKKKKEEMAVSLIDWLIDFN